jgi:hypothetical protein
MHSIVLLHFITSLPLRLLEAFCLLVLFHVSLFAKEMAIRHSPDAKMLTKAGLIAIVKIKPIDIKLIPKKRKLR